MTPSQVIERLTLAAARPVLTGSQAINGEGNDTDVLVFMPCNDAWSFFCNNAIWPYPDHCSRAGGNYPEDEMSVWKVPSANTDILVCHSLVFYNKMLNALHRCKEVRSRLDRPMDKRERVAIHQYIVDGLPLPPEVAAL